jgi:hypothetical protein
MGVDVMMFAVLPKGKHLNEEQIIDYSYRLASIDGIAWHSGHEQRRCIQVDTENIWDVPKRDTDQLLEIKSLDRYYGIGYARGSFPRIYITAKWIQHNLPDAKVYYGGDCQGSINELWEDQEAKLMEHYLTSGNSEYRQGWKMPGDPKAPICDFDKKPMIAAAWGGSRVGYYCPACKIKKTVENGIEKIIEKGKDYFD